MEAVSSRELRFGFVGGGIIAAVFIERLLASGSAPAERILATDNLDERLAMLREKFGVLVSANNADAGTFADVLFIAVPPPAVDTVLRELRPTLRPGSLVISLAAAVPIPSMKPLLVDTTALVRVIPNTPSQVGFGMNPYCCEPATSEADKLRATEILSIFGQALEIPEDMMNAATALTAVGPTYLFPLLTALKREAIQQGLSETDAHFAVAHMVLGTAQLLLATGEDPGVLKLMIGTRTISEDAADSVVAQAYRLALEKINGGASDHIGRVNSIRNITP